MSYCTECQKALPVDGDFITCWGCDSFLHFGCSTITVSTYNGMGRDRKLAWRCRLCKIADKVVKLFKERVDKQIIPQIIDSHTTTSESNVIIPRLDKLSADITASTENIKQLAAKLQNFSDTQALLTARVEKLEDKIDPSVVAFHNSDIICDLKSKINTLEQDCISNQVIVYNISEKKNENLNSLMSNIAEKIGIPLDSSDIESLYRMRVHKKGAGDSNERDNANPIVVKFFSKAKRRSILRKKKGEEILDSDIVNGGSDKKIYLGEFLTTFNKKLLDQARLKANNTGWKFVWFSDGLIRARKEEGSRYIILRTERDLDAIN